VDAAIDRFQDATTAKPGYAVPFRYLVEAQEKKGLKKQAIASYSRYLRSLSTRRGWRQIRKKIDNCATKWSERKSKASACPKRCALRVSALSLTFFLFNAPSGQAPGARARIPRSASLPRGIPASATPDCSPSAAWDASRAASREQTYSTANCGTPGRSMRRFSKM